jgi:hypothetical protein
MDALAAMHDEAVQMIDMSIVRVHQHGACTAGNNPQQRHGGIEIARAVAYAPARLIRRPACRSELRSVWRVAFLQHPARCCTKR